MGLVLHPDQTTHAVSINKALQREHPWRAVLCLLRCTANWGNSATTPKTNEESFPTFFACSNKPANGLEFVQPV